MRQLSLEVVLGSHGTNSSLARRLTQGKRGGSAQEESVNEAINTLLADHLGVDSSSIAVVSGHGSPAKIVPVEGMANEALRATFQDRARPSSPGIILPP